MKGRTELSAMLFDDKQFLFPFPTFKTADVLVEITILVISG